MKAAVIEYRGVVILKNQRGIDQYLEGLLC